MSSANNLLMALLNATCFVKTNNIFELKCFENNRMTAFETQSNKQSHNGGNSSTKERVR